MIISCFKGNVLSFVYWFLSFSVIAAIGHRYISLYDSSVMVCVLFYDHKRKTNLKGRTTMKRTLTAMVIALVMILTLSVTAFADSDMFMFVTKSPTDENRRVGETAWFVANANIYDSLEWTFVAPDGTRYTVDEFGKLFPYASTQGKDSCTLRLDNVSADMNSWAAFCTLYRNGTRVETSSAHLWISTAPVTVSAAPATTPVTYLTGIDYTYNQPLYCDEYGYYMPAHPDADDDSVYMYHDEYGYYMPAHPDADDVSMDMYEDEFGTFTPAHPTFD